MRGLVVAGLLWTAVLCAQTADHTFEFHSSFWVNLHHFLLEQARTGPPSTKHPPQWRAAVDYYRRNLARRDLLSDEAARDNGRLSALQMAPSAKKSALAPEWIAVLDAAAPVYRKRWWPDHDRANRAWIAAVRPLLSRYSAALKPQLSAAYATAWPPDGIQTDVTEYADRTGAYTTLDPVHITVSSVNPGNQGSAALEILFHEASHALIAKVRGTLGGEARAQHKLFRRSTLWHAILFYTVGEFVQRQLGDYTPYADKNRLWDGSWQGLPAILDADWKPYLDGKIDLTTAARRLVTDYGIAP